MKREIPICHHCGEANGVKKHGISKSGHQRYYCALCKKTFQTNYIYKGKEQNIAAQVERLLSDELTPEQISHEIRVRLSTVEQHIKHLERMSG
ncbi:IS1 family transposase [Budviciaceae bacterium CWB-B4]|uniref:IS1 family transposase n=1 Tax=Limnobaculum xujianqingii TaxID=2738837 RepID=A0A9D7AL16_9GAMM|nr:hypothetical protein [Limnobaculum xujianqingii]MBK5074731.1 IS1 family transposase [Limnobaculum xujianqingii]MBK5177937.1 IS1 family transposase [Limnobaculum xujianqingii]